jgi:hypothetical protein
VAYTYEHNRALIEQAYRGVDFLANTPASVLDRVANYPETTVCVRPILPAGSERARD